MELYQEILYKLGKKKEARVPLRFLPQELKDEVALESYLALATIRDILRNPSFSDRSCFELIEELLTELECAGSDGGFRHNTRHRRLLHAPRRAPECW